jgi:site-specific DNA recombinase
MAHRHLRPVPARPDHPRDARSPGPAARPEPATPAPDTRAIVADCDARLARYQATLDAGGDPQAIADWTRQVKAERASALARDASQTLRNPSRRLTEDDIRALITTLGDLRDVLRDAGTTEKTAIYDQLGLKVTFRPGEAKIRAEVTFGPENYAEHAEQCGDMGRVRGGT